MKQKHFIDSHKGATCLWVLGLMWYYNNWNDTTAWVYLGLHGTYGILWILKSLTFGDKQWEQPTGIVYALMIWGSLSLYWIAPWMIISDTRILPMNFISTTNTIPAWYLGLSITLYTFGVFFHFASDMQKHITLSLRKGLITEGLWARTRNPNYFGELLIYLGFSMLAMDWIPLLALGAFVLFFWLPNMIRKDKSLSRYPEFAEYKKRSGMIIPYIL